MRYCYVEKIILEKGIHHVKHSNTNTARNGDNNKNPGLQKSFWIYTRCIQTQSPSYWFLKKRS